MQDQTSPENKYFDGNNSRPISAVILGKPNATMSKTRTNNFGVKKPLNLNPSAESLTHHLVDIQIGNSRAHMMNQKTTANTQFSSGFKPNQTNGGGKQSSSLEQSTQISSTKTTFYNPKSGLKKGGGENGKPPINMKAFQRNSSVSVMVSRAGSNFKGNSFQG